MILSPKTSQLQILYLGGGGGQRKGRNVLFLACYAVCAGVSNDKEPANQNLWLLCSRSTKFPNFFWVQLLNKKLCNINMAKVKQHSIEMLIRTR
jgi:hypothetical protein